MQIFKHNTLEKLRLETKRFVKRQWLTYRIRDLKSDANFSQGPLSIVGYFSSTIGLGQGARLLYDGLRDQGVDVHAIDVTHKIVPHLVKLDFEMDSDPMSGPMIFHVNPPETLDVLASFNPNILKGRARIGLWLWELETAPANWRNQLPYFDAIWSPSNFSAESIRTLGVDVKRSGYPFLPVQSAKTLAVSRTRETAFTALVLADTQSSLSRKNPVGAVSVFQKSFPTEKNVRLKIKLSNSLQASDMLNALKNRIESDPRIVLIDSVLNPEIMSELIGNSDVLLNLHRAEGFGLPIAEALQMGVPAIYTDWSSPHEFNILKGAYPIEYSLKQILDTQGIYRNGRWAEPDEASACKALKEVYTKWLHIDKNFTQKDLRNAIADDAKNYFSAEQFYFRNIHALQTLGLKNAP